MVIREQQTTGPLDVLIIGAGIAGLASAIALRKQGHKVTIIEKSRFATETGAAIHVPPNCTALLEWMGIHPKDFGANILTEIHRYDAHDNLLFKKEFGDIRQHWQAEWYLMHRVDLHTALKHTAIASEKEMPGVPVRLYTNCKVKDIEQSTGTVELEDGRIFSGDLLIGADGVHSFTRSKILQSLSQATNENIQPTSTNKSCFRWLVPKESLLKNADTALYVSKPGVFIEWADKDRRLVAYPCSNDGMLNLCAFVPTCECHETRTNKVQEQGEKWDTTGNKTALRRAFSGFSPGVKALIDMAGDDLKIWELLEMPTLPSWTTGRTVLLGDAAHPFQPYMGQGATMAIEDGVAIATLLPSNATHPSGIHDRLKLFEQCRKPRVTSVQEYTRLNGRDEDDVNGPRMTAAGMVEAMRFIFIHDEVGFSTQRLEEALAATS